MPVYDQSYRTYQGAVRSHGRWLVIAGQEQRVLFSRRMFKFSLVYLALLFAALPLDLALGRIVFG